MRTERNIFMTINIVAAIAMGILLFFILKQQGQISHEDLLIQQERAASILRSCRGQNKRHTETLKTVNVQFDLAEQGASSARIGELEGSKHFTVLIINALAPKQDCLKMLHKAVPSYTSTIPAD